MEKGYTKVFHCYDRNEKQIVEIRNHLIKNLGMDTSGDMKMNDSFIIRYALDFTINHLRKKE